MREGLRLIIAAQKDMEVVAEVGDGAAAVDLAQQLRPDVVVMDVSMPTLSGLKATERVKAVCPLTRVLALTRHGEDGYVRQLLAAGATGYVLKQSPPSELLNGIRTVALGGTYVDPAVSVSRNRLSMQRPGTVEAAGITPREEAVLRLVAEGHSNKEIAGKLDLSVKTVETHKANAMRKLGMRSRIDVVRFALAKGWLSGA